MFTKKIILLATLFSALSCAGIEKKTNDVNFALVANTLPESAFKTNPAELAKLIDSINKDNPTFLIHLGNLIQGGSSKSGIIKNDVEKQLDSAKKNSRVSDPLHILSLRNMISSMTVLIFLIKEKIMENTFHLITGPFISLR